MDSSSAGELTAEVWGTQANLCPAESWDALDPGSIQKESDLPQLADRLALSEGWSFAAPT